MHFVCVQPEEVDFRPFKDWVLKKETELRLEVENNNTLDIKVCCLDASVYSTAYYKQIRELSHDIWSPIIFCPPRPNISMVAEIFGPTGPNISDIAFWSPSGICSPPNNVPVCTLISARPIN